MPAAVPRAEDARDSSGSAAGGGVSPLRVAIVDDEELARAVVREHLAGHPDVEVVAECANGLEAIEAVAAHAPDLVFLDVQMPRLTGFETLELLDPRPAVVFVTAYDRHAVKAFEVNAVDYLLKPFSKERFDAALAKARTLVGPGAARPDPSALAAAARPEGVPLERIAVREGTRVSLLPVESVDWVKAEDDYVLIRSGGKNHLKHQTLADLAARGFDPPRAFAAFFHTMRWNCVTATASRCWRPMK